MAAAVSLEQQGAGLAGAQELARGEGQQVLVPTGGRLAAELTPLAALPPIGPPQPCERDEARFGRPVARRGQIVELQQMADDLVTRGLSQDRLTGRALRSQEVD